MDPHVTDKAGTPAEGNAAAGAADGGPGDATALAPGGATPAGDGGDSGAAGGQDGPGSGGRAADGPATDGSPAHGAAPVAPAADGDAAAAWDTPGSRGPAADRATADDDATDDDATDGGAPQGSGPAAAAAGAQDQVGGAPETDGPSPAGGDDGHATGGGPDAGDGSGDSDSAAGSGPPAGDDAAGGDGPPADGDRPAGGEGGGAPRKRHWLRWAALGTSVVVLAAAGAGWWFYRKLDSNITTDTSAAAELETYERERPASIATGAENILLLGSDTREGAGNDRYGKDEGGGGSQRSDTTILLHIAADRKSATAMSVPRDLMVTIPSCRKPDGKRTREQTAQFNWAFQFGGAACTIRTVEKFTGIRIDHHMVIDFRGFKDMVDAVDGVEICLQQPIDDKAARLKLAAGRQTLHGEEALGFVRARKTLGDGSDTERMERQQQFLGALVKKVQSNGVLLNPTRLYPVLDAATKSITTDPGLDSLKDLYDLTRSLRNVPTEKVQFLTVPRQPYHLDPNRDELVEPEAGELFERLREDAPVTVVPEAEKEAAEAAGESPSPDPTFSGTNAADGTCG
ncbi:LCP family protein [Streptomyces sp. t39]|uniref:LCP family protein n=1 Tax=Streptomyces sp. t39 TaxID=1828156 RepID=UPI0011CDAA3E|nr:LCP family protein [Streptomyces sp. t39]TXS55456.1 LytR family transcriptional regulator [Streptomyces sp. t39]